MNNLAGANRSLWWQLFGTATTVLLLVGCAAATAEMGDPERGREIFETGGGVTVSGTCSRCHSLDGSVGRGLYDGPSIQGISEVASKRVPGMTAEEYLRQSIVDPSAYLVEDFNNFMPQHLREYLSEENINDLVAFMLTQ
jgi:mono/diheme cytochrome c family protein